MSDSCEPPIEPIAISRHRPIIAVARPMDSMPPASAERRWGVPIRTPDGSPRCSWPTPGTSPCPQRLSRGQSGDGQFEHLEYRQQFRTGATTDERCLFLPRLQHLREQKGIVLGSPPKDRPRVDPAHAVWPALDARAGCPLTRRGCAHTRLGATRAGSRAWRSTPGPTSLWWCG